MITLRRNELHDWNGISHVIMRQVAQQSIGGRHDSVADVRVKLPLIEKLDVVDTFRWIVWNVLRCPVEILS